MSLFRLEGHSTGNVILSPILTAARTSSAEVPSYGISPVSTSCIVIARANMSLAGEHLLAPPSPNNSGAIQSKLPTLEPLCDIMVQATREVERPKSPATLSKVIQ